MNVLYINTTNREKIIVQIKKGNSVIEEHALNESGSQSVLQLISKLLEENHMTLLDINAIEVHVGKGSFTGIRVGVAIGNALALALYIPINGKPVGEFVNPSYE